MIPKKIRTASAAYLCTLAAASLMQAQSGCSSTGAADRHAGESTGVAIAAILQVPANVGCVVLYSSDPLAASVAQDVTPGATNVTIQIGPLATGVVSLRGEAYTGTCAARAADASTSRLSWEAPWTTTVVTAGGPSPVTLSFVPVSGVAVTLDFAGGDASTDAGPAMCEVAQKSTMRTAPPFPPTTIPVPTGTRVRAMNNCAVPLWISAMAPVNTVQMNPGATLEWDAPAPWTGRMTAYGKAAPGAAGSVLLQFVEMTLNKTALSYDDSNVGEMGLPVEVSGIGTDPSCGVSGCYTKESTFLTGCPAQLATGATCESPAVYCASSAHSGEAFCKALDSAATFALTHDPVCETALAKWIAAVPGRTQSSVLLGAAIFNCSDFWTTAPDCCAHVNRGLTAGVDVTNNCNYYVTSPYNVYAKFAHQKCPINYAFPYDDVNGQSGFHACAKGTEIDVTWCPGG
jgi:hypothetical protein